MEQGWENRRFNREERRRYAQHEVPSSSAKRRKKEEDQVLQCTLFRCKAAAAVIVICAVLTKTGSPLGEKLGTVYNTLLNAPMTQSAQVWQQTAAETGISGLMDQLEDSIMVYARGAAEDPSATENDEIDLTEQGGQFEWNSGLPPGGVTLARPVFSAPAAAPTNGKLSCGFGPRQHPITEKDDFHTGIDIAAVGGSGIYAAWPGVVLETGSSAIYGNYITIDHGGGLVTAYCHCQSLLAQTGVHVRAGERIATVGSTGISTGNHLHFELQLNGLSADPLCAFDL